VRFFGSAQIKIGDPMLMCHQLVGLPYHDLTTGILRSAQLSICRCFQGIIARICMAHASVAAISNPDAVAQLANMAASSHPMSVAVVGLEMLRFEQFGLSVNNGEPILWKADTASSSPPASHKQAGDSSVDSDLDAKTDLDAAPGQSGQHPPVSVQTSQPVPPVSAHTSQPVLPVPAHTSQPVPPQRPSHPDIYAQRQSNPQIPATATAGGRRKTPPLGSPIQSGEAPLPSGSKVLVYWNDGLWRNATVRHYEAGRYQIALEGSDSFAWVQANQIRPT
jgi:hypothetical protein